MAAEAFSDHVFGVVLVNDWSARDLQAWESVPLGPFLGKSFATSVSPWVVPLDALQKARKPIRTQSPAVLPYLHDVESWCLDLALEVRVNGTLISEPPFATHYWSPGQQLAHLTVNGASLRTGDLFASGTVTGPGRRERGSLLELTWGGREPLTLDDGSERTFLEDGDVVSISATAPDAAGGRLTSERWSAGSNQASVALEGLAQVTRHSAQLERPDDLDDAQHHEPQPGDPHQRRQCDRRPHQDHDASQQAERADEDDPPTSRHPSVRESFDQVATPRMTHPIPISNARMTTACAMPRNAKSPSRIDSRPPIAEMTLSPCSSAH